MPSPPPHLSTISQVIEAIEAVQPWLGETVKEACADLKLHMVFNQARKASDTQLGCKLHAICHKHLSLDLNYAGLVYYNEQVPSSVLRMQPISMSAPESVTALSLKKISQCILAKTLNLNDDDFDRQAQRVQESADAQYALNHISRRQEQRAHAAC